MAKKRKGFTWTRKKAWAICKGRAVAIDRTSKVIVVCATEESAEAEVCPTDGETVHPCEIVVKVKGD